MAKKTRNEILVDTNILIQIQRGNKTVLDQLGNIPEELLYISLITYGEFFGGAPLKKTERL